MAAAFAAPLSAKARRCGDTPSVIACGDATFPKGTAFGSGGKVFGYVPPVKKQLWKIRRFSRVANIKIFFPLFMRKANAEHIPNRFFFNLRTKPPRV